MNNNVRHQAYNKMLRSLKCEEKLSELKELCKNILSKRSRDEIKSSCDLWKVLEHRLLLSEENLTFLKVILKYEELPAELRKVTKYEQQYAEVNDNQYAYEVRQALFYCADNVGRNWRHFARMLMVPDAIIDNAVGTEHEKIISCLLYWQRTEGDDATLERIIQALRDISCNHSADNLLHRTDERKVAL